SAQPLASPSADCPAPIEEGTTTMPALLPREPHARSICAPTLGAENEVAARNERSLLVNQVRWSVTWVMVEALVVTVARGRASVGKALVLKLGAQWAAGSRYT